MPEGSHTSARYPWYDVVNGPELQQGDIILNCPVLKMTLQDLRRQESSTVEVADQNAIILSQSCDLALRRDNTFAIEDVILCPIYSRQELENDKIYGKPAKGEEARKGRHASYHVLTRCDIENHSFDSHLVD